MAAPAGPRSCGCRAGSSGTSTDPAPRTRRWWCCGSAVADHGRLLHPGCPIPLTSVARVRSVLAPLQRIAQDTGVSILVTHDVTKSGSVAGSAAVVDAARSVLVINRDPSNPQVRCVKSVKSNMGSQKPPVVRYAIEGDDDSAHVRCLS